MSPSQRLCVFAEVCPSPEHFEKVKDLVLAIRDDSINNEQDTHVYRVTVTQDEPKRILIFEEYSNQSALDTHMSHEPFQSLVKYITDNEGAVTKAPVITKVNEI